MKIDSEDLKLPSAGAPAIARIVKHKSRGFDVGVCCLNLNGLWTWRQLPVGNWPDARAAAPAVVASMIREQVAATRESIAKIERTAAELELLAEKLVSP